MDKPAHQGIRQAQAGSHPDGNGGGSAGQALQACGTSPDGHACDRGRRLCADAGRELRTEGRWNGSAVNAANRHRMPAAGIFFQWWPRRLRRIVVAQQFLRRRCLIKPFVIRHVWRVRFGRSDARRIRWVCAGVRGAFFRRRLRARYLRRTFQRDVRLLLAPRRRACLNVARQSNIRSAPRPHHETLAPRRPDHDGKRGHRRCIDGISCERRDCGPGFLREVTRGLDGRPVVTCQGVAYGGFGRWPHQFHGHGHGHGHAHGGG